VSLDDLITELLSGQACPACGTPSADPGQPCGSCGALPSVTRPELAAALETAPLAAAEILAQKAIAQGYVMLDAAIGQIHEADRIRLTARLEITRDAAQRAFDGHKRDQAALQAPLRSARKAMDKAAAELQSATGEHAQIALQKETAERYHHGLAAETEAALKLEVATQVLRRYQSAFDQASAHCQAAGNAVAAAAARATALEAARDKARAAVTDPGRIGYGAETITAGLLRLLAGGKLTDAEVLIAGTLGSWVCAITGAMEGIEGQARAHLLAEQEAAARGRDLHLLNGQDGVTAVPNPHNPDVPQPYHPPAQGNQPHPVQAATTPGWNI
jgi:hypothetical protein